MLVAHVSCENLMRQAAVIAEAGGRRVRLYECSQCKNMAVVRGRLRSAWRLSDLLSLKSGLNQFLALATNGSDFTSLILHSNTGFSEIKQIQISGLTQTPLPGALALLGPVLGLGYLGVRRRQRRQALAA